MATIACTEKPEILPEPVSDTRTVTINASLPDTRVAVDGEGKTTWTAGDAIAVWNTEGTKFQFDIESGAGTETATFKCTTFEGTLGSKAVYPYAWAGAAEGTVTIPEYIPWVDGYVPAVMASTVSEITAGEVAPLYFHSLMAIMDFTLQDVPAYACALKLWSASGADLHGTWTVSGDCTSLTDITTGGNTQQVIYFPYKTAYGAEASIKIRAAVPAYAYTDLKIRVLDGDETVIEGTGKLVPTSVTSQMDGNLSAYVTMPALNVRSLVGSARDNFVKVEGVKWAKGNLRAWKSGTTGTGWQTGWNVYDNQWESQYMLLNETNGSAVNFSLNTSIYKEDSVYTHWDYFTWGTLARASRVYNQVLYSSIADYAISGYVYSSAAALGTTIEAATDISGLTKLNDDERWVSYESFGSTNRPYAGDLAFWASNGQFRMPTSAELSMLYSKAGVTSGRANMQAGQYTVGGKTVKGLLFTSTPPHWATEPTYNTGVVELTDADIESGLFLPSIGIRGTIPETFNSMDIRGFNSWGAYWSGTFGTKAVSGFEKTARAIGWKSDNALMNGYTNQISNNSGSLTYEDPRCGNAIRPVLVD